MDRSNYLKMTLHEDSGTALYEADIVPSERHLKSLFPSGVWDEAITIKDISKNLNELLLKLISEGADAPEALISPCQPISFLVANTVNFNRRRISEESILQYGFHWCFLDEDAQYLYPRSHLKEIQIESEICVETADISNAAIPDGTSFGVRLMAAACDLGLHEKMDEYRIWGTNANQDRLKLAIKVMGQKKFGDSTKDNSFAFGPHFFSSAHQYGGIDGGLKSILMEHITTLVYAPEKAEFSEFRNSHKKSSGVRTRESDKAKAYRMHLTKSHEGFRLMFWRLEDGSIEFANVGPKFEEKII